MDALLSRPIAFAHRGARAHAPENTLDAFRLALRLGATGLETDIWLTADGAVVMDHDGVVRVGLRRRPFCELTRASLPEAVITLDDLYGACGADYELSLDLKDPAAAGPAVAAATAAGAAGRLWLCHPDWRQVVAWRELSADVRLVNSTRRRAVKKGMERRAATLADAGVDALNLHHTDWTGGFVTLVHRFGRYALAWDCQHPRVLAGALAMGMDGVYSDHVDRMVDALDAALR